MSENKEYIHKEGRGSLFKNSYKKKDNDPDFKGTGTTLDGKQIQIAMWKGETQSGQPKLSLTFSPPYVKKEEKQTSPDGKQDDGLGF
tara:strand:+ start:801 stop:1061 length:261 start_codon:yes stop_codon:yes gene_type:complete